MNRIITILLTHQPQSAVLQMREYWLHLDPDQELIIAYGGPAAAWQDEVSELVRVDDPELRTRDHPRERQSYLGVMKAVLPLIERSQASHVHFAEFDEIPLVSDLNQRLLDLMAREKADLLGHRLYRVDDTTQPHAMDHMREEAFMAYWRSVSGRDDSTVVLSMLGCGSFWTRECFIAVASLCPPVRMYLEIFLPTAAHHLGYRVRPILGQDESMAPEILKSCKDVERYREKGAWRVHPVKEMWGESGE
jgi:hypothetical protein